jgi:hypothetical protein
VNPGQNLNYRHIAKEIIVKFFLIIGTFILLSFSTFIQADKYVPEHLCFKPEPPLFMASPYHKKMYQKDISQYKFCIRDFIKDQEQAINIHQEAIKKATSDWNEFVEKES